MTSPNQPADPSPTGAGAAPSRRRLDRRTFLKATGGIAGMVAAARAPAMLGCVSPNEVLRLGFVGTGARGHQMLKTLGYFHSQNEKEGPTPLPRLDSVEVVAVCDAYDDNLASAVEAVAHLGGRATPYVRYEEMLEKEKLDAVIVATSDHQHVPVSVAAMNAGCDVYVEKCMTNSIAELELLRATIRDTKRIVQVGHQHRQDAIRRGAKEIVAQGHLGKVIQVRSSHAKSTGWNREWQVRRGLRGVHWDEFLGPAPKRPPDPSRFFEWRLYWDYGTGIAGDVLSHELDNVHFLLDLGPPRFAVASGGVYYWKDGRETPDTLTAVLEYPDHDLQVTYTASLHNEYHPPSVVILGRDATLELDHRARVFPDRASAKYARQLEAEEIFPDVPILEVGKRHGELQQAASVSNLWLKGLGVGLTMREGKLRDTSRLHHENFYDCMRTRQAPEAGFDTVYGPTLATHLTVEAYKRGRRVEWDRESRTIKEA